MSKQLSFSQFCSAQPKRQKVCSNESKNSPFSGLGSNYKKEICTSLMEVTHNIPQKKTLSNGKEKEVLYTKFICPRPNCQKKSIFVEKNSDYSNALSHLTQCYGGEDELLQSFKEAEQLSREHTGSTKELKLYFDNVRASAKHKDLYCWIEFIVEDNIPLSDGQLLKILKMCT